MRRLDVLVGLHWPTLALGAMAAGLGPCNQHLQGLASAAQEWLTGASTKPWMRMPFGARNQHTWEVVGAEGYTSIFWTLDSGDWLADATTAIDQGYAFTGQQLAEARGNVAAGGVVAEARAAKDANGGRRGV